MWMDILKRYITEKYSDKRKNTTTY